MNPHSDMFHEQSNHYKTNLHHLGMYIIYNTFLYLYFSHKGLIMCFVK